MKEKSYYLGFSNFSGIGPGRFGKLLKEFGSAEKAWNAGLAEIEKVLGQALSPKFIEHRKTFSISEYEDKLKKAKVWYLALVDEDYPVLLKQIKKPPFVLYYKGNIDVIASGAKQSLSKNLPAGKAGIAASPSAPVKQAGSLANAQSAPRNDGNYIAIVGTRRITEYGRQVTESLTSDLVASGFVIVSGLALGVDACSHKTTIENKGKTIAVLGCGVDCCYPTENQRIYNSILETGGAIVSEYPLGEPPSKGSFPSRNRIIAGLSQAVLVTEGAADSGALYTAEEAFSINRPVFAVPGPITSSLSKGPHSLIGKGGRLISSAGEIIETLGITGTTSITGTTGKKLVGATKEEQKIIDVLENEAMHFNEIAKRAKIKPSKLGGILSIMEMKGIIKSQDAGFFGLV